MMEFIGTLAANIRLTCPTDTSIQIAAGTGSAQAAIGIDGKWRYRSSDFPLAVGAGAAVRSVWVVAVTDNDFTGAGSDPDETDYNFELRITDSGTDPTGVAAFRKIGELDWAGGKITGLRQKVGSEDQTLPSYPVAPIASAPALVARGAASQTAAIAQVLASDGTVLFEVQADGDVKVRGHLAQNNAEPASPPDWTVTGSAGDRTLNADNTTVNELAAELNRLIADLQDRGILT